MEEGVARGHAGMAGRVELCRRGFACFEVAGTEWQLSEALAADAEGNDPIARRRRELSGSLTRSPISAPRGSLRQPESVPWTIRAADQRHELHAPQ